MNLYLRKPLLMKIAIRGLMNEPLPIKRFKSKDFEKNSITQSKGKRKANPHP